MIFDLFMYFFYMSLLYIFIFAYWTYHSLHEPVSQTFCVIVIPIEDNRVYYVNYFLMSCTNLRYLQILCLNYFQSLVILLWLAQFITDLTRLSGK